MKVRMGFVSNSSSTSFCIYGTFIKGFTDEHEEKVEKLHLEYEYDQEGSGAYIGMSFNKMKDDETKLQFKTRIIQAINDTGLIYKNGEVSVVTDISIITEGWYEG